MTQLENVSLVIPRGKNGINQPSLVTSTIQTNEMGKESILLRVEKFSFSTNNITYGILGDHPDFRYFEFHSPPNTCICSPSTHGMIPVWGFGTVIASSYSKIKVGERLYGYLAMTRYLILPIVSSNNTNIFVSRPHLPKDFLPYNTLTRCSSDSMWKLENEEVIALWRPLFWTSFFMEDWLSTESYKGANTVLISSASSKTAFALAYSISKKDHLPKKKIVGLTSQKNVEFTKRLQLYDEVFSYEDLSKLNISRGKWIYVDVAGNSQLNEQIFQTFEDGKNPLLAGIGLGLTNPQDWDNVKKRSMEFFFLPTWLAKRRKQLAPGEITKIQEKAWANLMNECKDWLKLETTWMDQLLDKYKITASGKLSPEIGQTFSLFESQNQFSQSKL